MTIWDAARVLPALRFKHKRVSAHQARAKSILDAAWGRFLTILEAVAIKRGVRVVKVNPYGTSQDCSECGRKVPKDLSIRTYEYPPCSTVLDRDVNAVLNILQRGINAVGLTVSVCGGLGDTQPVNQKCPSEKKGAPAPYRSCWRRRTSPAGNH